MSLEKAARRSFRLLRKLGAHGLETTAKVRLEAVVMDDADDQRCSGRYHHVLSSGMDCRAGCHHIVSWTICTDRMPSRLVDDLVALLAGEAL